MFLFGPHKIRQSEIFHSSSQSVCLVNIRPVVPGHVMVVPKEPHARFSELSTVQVTDLFITASLVVEAIQVQFNPSSFTLTIQDGKDAGQSVPHVHLVSLQ